MSIWNKILVGLILVASVVFFFMGARTLRTHENWRKRAQQLQRDIAGLQKENYELQFGVPEEGDDGMGIVQLRSELQKMVSKRGRVWYNCSPRLDNPEAGRFVVETDFPDPHKIAAKTILYVFEENDVRNGGRYVGEFRVTDVGQREVILEPAMKLSEDERKRLAASRGPWTLYEIIPIDSRGAFADLNDEQKKAVLPESTVREYIKDGKPAEPNDPEDRVVDGKYVRMLRDYRVLFKSFHSQRSVLIDLYEAAVRDKQYVDRAYADALEQQKFREEEKRTLKADLAKYRKQRDQVRAWHDLLSSRVANIRLSVDRLIARNLAVAGRIAKLQLDAVRRIDARTRSMAQAEAAQ